MRFVSIALACFVTALAAPAGAMVLHPMMPQMTAASARPMTLAAMQGTFAGQVSPGESISILVRLQGRHESELAAFVATLQNPQNANPRYLTPQEFGRYFGADPLTYGRAIAALRAAGFTIDDMYENQTDIAAHAPAMRVAAFFNTPLDRRFERGRLFFTARYEPRIPPALGNATISGLDDYVQFHPLGLRRANRAPGGNFTPDDIAGVYNLMPLYQKGLNGKGITIANSTAGAASESDLAAFQQHFGLPASPMITKAVVGTPSPLCGGGCDNTESTIDAESASSVARGATFYQVVAPSLANHAFDLSYEFIVNKLSNVHVATTSYGLCEREFQGTKSKTIDENLMAQAAAEGQFWFSASGDNGTDDCEDRGTAVSADFPGTSPYVISVGGTNVQGNVAGGSVTSWASESTWQFFNSNLSGASGGGKSIFYTKPIYQKGVTPNDGVRDVPDVALIADPYNDGFYVYVNGRMESGWGGTSFAAPMWASFLAIVEQSKEGQGKPFLDPHSRLYALANSPRYPNLFHDIISGNNGVPAGAEEPYYSRSFPGYNAGKGFDLTTGWGSFNAAPLLKAY